MVAQLHGLSNEKLMLYGIRTLIKLWLFIPISINLQGFVLHKLSFPG